MQKRVERGKKKKEKEGKEIKDNMMMILIETSFCCWSASPSPKRALKQLAISTENEKQAEEQIYKQQQALIVELTALDKRLGAFIAKAKVGSKTAGVDQGGKSAQTDQKPKKVEEVKSTSKAESNITQQKESGADEQSRLPAESGQESRKEGKEETAFFSCWSCSRL
uniref:Uncharacterized protein n=1 Tax=Ditylenchus dipsaci TaxID=166011 RepID=A0A915E130_9BILA